MRPVLLICLHVAVLNSATRAGGLYLAYDAGCGDLLRTRVRCIRIPPLCCLCVADAYTPPAPLAE